LNELVKIEFKNQRILTTEQLAGVYETETKRISENFNYNKERFQEGKHYHLLQGEELKEFKIQYGNCGVVNKKSSQLYLWTERGADRHCKMLGTDKAWEQFDNLEETYFRVKEDITFKLPTNYKEALLQLVQAEEEKEKLQLVSIQKDQIIGELKPKADYLDSILKNPGLVTITQIAKDYGFSGTKLNEILHNLEVQYKQSEQWLLYSTYHDKGYTHSQTIPITHNDGRKDVRMNTKWTQKGRLFLYNLLKEIGTLPNIEQKEFKEAI